MYIDLHPLCFAALLCPPLQDPANGRVVVPSREVGAEATYICDPDYELSGLASRTCQSDGSWFGLAPTCVPGTVLEICKRHEAQIEMYNTKNHRGGVVCVSCKLLYLTAL